MSKETLMITALTKLYGSDTVAKTFLDAAASRKLDVQETSIDQFITMGKTDRLGAVGLGRKLEEVGVGKLVIGRSGHKTRFKWAFSLPNMGKVASGSTKELKPISPDAEPADVIHIPRQGSKASQAGAAAVIQGGKVVALTIPEAKKQLAEVLGVHPGKIEISIRD